MIDKVDSLMDKVILIFFKDWGFWDIIRNNGIISFYIIGIYIVFLRDVVYQIFGEEYGWREGYSGFFY